MNIVFDNVSKQFGNVTALDNISLKIGDGELFFLLGPSGCGKTTMLRAIAGLETTTSGRILFDGEDITNTPTHKRNTGMVFQGYALWPHMTVTENVAFGLDIRGTTQAERASKVGRALKQVQITELADRKPNELSGGQQQRVALARTLVIEPSCLLLDEPLANLDAKLRRDMRAGIRSICKESGLTAIYVTHDREEALSMADRVAVLDRGTIQQIGPPEDIYRRPVNPFVAGFIGEANFLPGKVKGLKGTAASVDTVFGLLSSTTTAPDIAEGQLVTLSIRPEAIRIVTNGDNDDAPNNFQATVVDSVYLGNMAEHHVKITDGISLKLCELNPRGQIAPDDRVRIAVDAADVVCLKAEGR